METHIAIKKDHRCDACGRRIPLGSRYFFTDAGEKEHTNCLDFENEDRLDPNYNHNRKLGKVKSSGVIEPSWLAENNYEA